MPDLARTEGGAPRTWRASLTTALGFVDNGLVNAILYTPRPDNPQPPKDSTRRDGVTD
jgi:hypothetical protein